MANVDKNATNTTNATNANVNNGSNADDGSNASNASNAYNGSTGSIEELYGYKAYIDAVLLYATKQKIPSAIYDATRELATSIAAKMRIYSDAMAGKIDPTNVSVLLQHYNLMQNLRTTRPDKYKQLVFFANVYPTLSYDDQRIQILAFFNGF